MPYRGPGFLAVVCFGSSPAPFPLTLDRRHTGRPRKRDKLLMTERGGGVKGVGEDRKKAWSSINHWILPETDAGCRWSWAGCERAGTRRGCRTRRSRLTYRERSPGARSSGSRSGFSYQPFLFFTLSERTYNVYIQNSSKNASCCCLHRFRSVEGVLWGAEPRFELGPALQQADGLLLCHAEPCLCHAAPNCATPHPLQQCCGSGTWCLLDP